MHQRTPRRARGRAIFRDGALACATVLSLASPASTARAAPSQRIDYVFYTAQIAPHQTLRDALDAATPIVDGGDKFHALTRWSVSWYVHWYESPSGACRITDAQITVASTLTLPRLTGADTAQSVAFERYLAALKTHELGHHAIGMRAGAAVERALLALPVATRCRVLEDNANATAQRVLGSFSSADADYDRATGHGESQGAWLP